MAVLFSHGTRFAFSVLETEERAFWVNTTLSLKNEYLAYEAKVEVSREEIRAWCVGMSRLLAGGYERAHTISFEKAGLAVDLYAHTESGVPVSRTQRRKEDCVMAVQILLRSTDGERFLGGVFSLIFHRAEIEIFVAELRREMEKNCVQLVHGTHKYRFAGVSPLGYQGCEYLYLDDKNCAERGGYVWVRMGRHNTEQIVYVDVVEYFDDASVPYNPKTVKRILRKATEEEIQEIL